MLLVVVDIDTKSWNSSFVCHINFVLTIYPQRLVPVIECYNL